MTTDNLFASMTSKVLVAFGGKQSMVFHAANKTVSMTGAIFLESEYSGVDLQVVEPRWTLAADRSTAPVMRRGDRITDGSGNDWVLGERLSQDEWNDNWAISAK